MLASLVDLGRESTSGGLDRQLATTFSLPAMCQISDVYSATSGIRLPVQGEGERLVVREHVELPPFQRPPEVPDSTIHIKKLPVKSEVLLLSSVQLPGEKSQRLQAA